MKINYIIIFVGYYFSIFFFVSSVIYALDGSEKWFSRLAFAVVISLLTQILKNQSKNYEH